MNASGQNWRKNQLIAITKLAIGAKPGETAAEAGVSTSTLRRWRQDSNFAAEVAAVRAEILAAAAGRLADRTSAAADTLGELLEDENSTVRLGAARAILTLAPNLVEHTELVERIEALEAAQSLGKGRSWAA